MGIGDFFMCSRNDARALDLGYFESGYTSTDDCQQHIQLELNPTIFCVRAAKRIHISHIFCLLPVVAYIDSKLGDQIRE
ncbi:hypothetical protein SAMN03080598_01000 [Algoriphagus boritolerans DSM 17298 = JCM 18970]|uniref:Uncharacterized protein n=1 Tax=Algoriphagus boritolerans DSM 17298 = JCM 18970 TaxID=1120964 RepID=A0A1H5TY25_9BACT|nr:hypothetical protein SAMN03080598_01000 [Algoriphagus boritolerans DSM 17298 = JCM 18970]